ncbi:MAG: VWA domain-containing protein [Candidatus Moraniibacteriota bacterium]
MHLKKSAWGAFGVIGAVLLGGCAISPTASVQTDQTKVVTDTNSVTVATGGTEQKDAEMQKPSMPKKNIVVIFDASGSMNATLNGEKKIDIAKRSLNAYIDSLATDVNLGLLAYGQAGSNTQAGKAVSCSTIEEKYFLGPVNSAVAKGKINAIFANGWTPITNALDKANAILAEHPGEDNRIVLVSDGEETCGGNPIEAARKVKASNARIDVIGFDVKGAVAEELKDISVEGGGGYVSIKDADDFGVVIKDGTINAITPNAVVSVSDSGNLSVQTGADSINMTDGALDMTSDAMNIKVKPGEMPKIDNLPSGTTSGSIPGY